jgi:hypothetical protein
MPATYGPRATIPSRGFLPDPDRLLRRRSTFPPRIQAAPTGIDSIMKPLVDFTVASPPIIDEEPVDDEGNEEYFEGEEDFPPGGQDIVRVGGRAVKDGVEDEGYETEVSHTPARVEEEDNDIFPLAEGYA